MANTYLTMQQRIADEIDRTDLTSQIKLAIQTAIAFYEPQGWFWQQSTDTSLTTVSGTASYTLPTTTIDLDSVEVTISSNLYELDPWTWQHYRWRNRGNQTLTGYPEAYVDYGGLLYLFPTPNGAYQVTLGGTFSLAALSADSDTNAWMTTGEELIRARAKADLFANVTMDIGNAQIAQENERLALSTLSLRNAHRTATGKLKPTAF